MDSELQVLLWIVGLFMYTISMAGAFFVGRASKGKPSMTVEVEDYRPLQWGGSSRTIYIKYHPKYGLFSAPVEDPMAHGLSRVVIKEGVFGWFKRYEEWETHRLSLPTDIRRGKATYFAELMNQTIRERLDRLAHENSDLRLKKADAENELRKYQRGAKEQRDEDRDEFVKQLVKLSPTLPNRPSRSVQR